MVSDAPEFDPLLLLTRDADAARSGRKRWVVSVWMGYPDRANDAIRVHQ